MDSSNVKRTQMKKRETWTRKIDFLFACVGLSIGLGNVWRFPFLCYRNGGGVFLIPYITCALLIGVPMVLLEVSLGQFMSEGGIGTWRICPLFQGVGLAATVIVGLLNCSYIIVLTWGFYYFFSSFTSTLPWSNCNNSWNTKTCSEFHRTNITEIPMLINLSDANGINNASSPPIRLTDPVTEFWEIKVLGLTDDISIPGPVKWDLALCLLLSWLVVYLCICKGIKSSGKVMYITATGPYVFIGILLVRGLTLDGAMKGIEYYLFPKWEKILEPKVWVDAGNQIFFSYATCLGVLTAMGSYNSFKHNTVRDVIMVCCINSCTSFLSGFVIFSTLGFMAHKQGVSVDDVAKSGPGLVFIVYPEAISQMPGAPVWAVLFFTMIILLGLDSQFVDVEGFITALVDLYPQYIRVGRRKEIFIAVICFIFFLVGLTMVTHGGMYVFQLFDFYSAGRITLLVGFLECAVVAWIYGVDRFLDNIQMMTGIRPGVVLKPCWLLLTPGFTLGIFIMGAISYSELTYKRKFFEYHFPPWAIGIGWMLALCSIVCVPLVMIVKVVGTKGSLLQRIRYLMKPVLKQHQIRRGEDMSKVRLVPSDHSDVTQSNEVHSQQACGLLPIKSLHEASHPV